MVQSVSILFKWFDPQPKQSGIVYFDGVCSVCNGFVDFLSGRDSNHSLQYTALQGEAAKENLNIELYKNIKYLYSGFIDVASCLLFQALNGLSFVLYSLPARIVVS